MTKIAILILAAGRSSRMGGRDKLLEEIDGTTLLARVTKRALATGMQVVVTVPDANHPRANLVKTGLASMVPVPDRDEGMAASIRAGVKALQHEETAVMILPADMPDLQTSDLRALSMAFAKRPNNILRATSADGTPGHPVIFPSDLLTALTKVTGDSGARSVIRANQDRLQTLSLPGNRAVCDLDTPQDWAKWRAAQALDQNKKAGR